MKKLFTLLAAAFMTTAMFGATNSYTITFKDGSSTSLVAISTSKAVSNYVTEESTDYISKFALTDDITYTSTYAYLKGGSSGWQGARFGTSSKCGNLEIWLTEKGQAKVQSITVNGKGTPVLTLFSKDDTFGTEFEFDCGEDYSDVTVKVSDVTDPKAYSKIPQYIDITSSDMSYIKSITVNYESTAVTLDETSTDGYTTSWNSSKTYDITCKRSMKVGKWNTFMAPFPMTSSEVKSAFGETAQLKKMTGVENQTVKFEDATTVARGEAYIVKPDEDVESFTVNCVNGMTTTYQKTASKTFDNWSANTQFKQFDLTEYANPTYVLANTDGTDKFYTVDADLTGIKGFRWYLVDNSGKENARQLSLSFDGETTGIEAINNEQVTMNNSEMFNLAGQRINASAKGIMIVNGKKVIK